MPIDQLATCRQGYDKFLLLFVDPTLTIDNLARVMEKVTSEKRRNVWTEVLRWDEDFPDFYPDIPPLDILLGHTPHSYINEVYTTYTTDEEKTRALADVYINIKPESSWQDLVETLYYENELAAVKEAKSFLQQNGK